MRTVYFAMPMKMRRNLKLVLFLSISWMFLMFYYFQSGNPKVSAANFHVIFLIIRNQLLIINMVMWLMVLF